MSSLQISASFCSSCSSSSIKKVNAAINVPKLPQVRFSLPKITPTTKKLVQEVNRSIDTIIPSQIDVPTSAEIYEDNYSKATIQLYAILEAVSDRIEMHNNMCEQRNNWNTLLLNSLNMMTLTASTMVGLNTAIDNSALKLSSTVLFTAATGMLLIMNKIQPSQLAEEQRNATRLFKQLQTKLQTTLAMGSPSEEDVNSAMEKVLALDKAYPLPLLGAMLEKFPSKYEPSVWWPKTNTNNEFQKQVFRSHKKTNNGWTPELETEMRQILEVMKSKDVEDYERLGNLALKFNKTLAKSGPLLTGIAALGCALGSHGSSWPGIVAAVAGSLAASVNALEHGGQVGMVFEMYRNCGGFFKLLQETIEATLEDNDFEKRENGELFEMKVAMKLGRSVSQLRQLASKFAAYDSEGIGMDEFASKLF